MERIGHVILIIIGIILTLTIVGFFARGFDSSSFLSKMRNRGENTTSKQNNKSCELTVITPLKNSIVTSPLEITGFAESKCGWQIKNGSLGTVELRTSSGEIVSIPAPIIALGDFQNGIVNFKSTLTFLAPPNFEKGNLIFSGKSLDGANLSTSLSVNFN